MIKYQLLNFLLLTEKKHRLNRTRALAKENKVKGKKNGKNKEGKTKIALFPKEGGNLKRARMLEATKTLAAALPCTLVLLADKKCGDGA